MIATFAIPCRNAGTHLRSLLESLLAQSRQDFEVLLVDDASTDGSVELARAVAGERLRIVTNGSPLGIGANWNRCAELVRTPFFCLAHQDDVYRPEYLATLLRALEPRPSALAAHCRATTLDAAGRESISATERFKDRFWARAGGLSDSGLYASLLDGNWVIAPSALFRTEVFQRLGGFEARLRFVLDWELWLRALRGGATLVGVAERLLAYRRHDASATKAEERSLNRYREEHDVGAAAHRAGIACGLLAPHARRGVAMRNDVLRDAYFDLRAGDRAAAAAKLAFVQEHATEVARDPLFRAFRALSNAGALGRWILSAGFRVVAGPAGGVTP